MLDWGDISTLYIEVFRLLEAYSLKYFLIWEMHYNRLNTEENCVNGWQNCINGGDYVKFVFMFPRKLEIFITE